MKKVLWGVITVLIGAILIAAVGVGFHSQQYVAPAGTQVAKSDGTVTVNGKTYQHVTLDFVTEPSAAGNLPNGKPVHPGGNEGWPAYAPNNQFQVPANSVVTIHWVQYDSGEVVNNAFFAKVQGTVGGKANINGEVVDGIDPSNMAHSFTVRGLPGVDPNFFVSVPAPSSKLGDEAVNDKGGVTVDFSFISGTKGLYSWNCEFPCGSGVGGFGGAMSSYGYMSGYIHVV
ncbi:MAG: hypothetical protein F2903_07440 [Actinobacteria bacterium]|uniref:Unannotated protein n=1 Tax=freshwater metagenome TaxID=449393 RepID=A0A6J7RL05_9ZZZZ|nr:hypothetical protein [Actinomycetota bacterium]MSX10741.1 hypothetical protein [Actinomycetota bacterium]